MKPIRTLEICVAILLPTAVACGLVLAFEPFRHWFILPVAVCGAICALGVSPWVMGRTDVFDPMPAMFGFGLHFFFGAPILHVLEDKWMRFVDGPDDWRYWLGFMACLNALGLIMAWFGARSLAPRVKIRSEHTWVAQRPKFDAVFIILGLVSVVLEGYVLARFGGIAGYANAFGDRDGAFEGMGLLFVFSESLPILTAIWLAQAVRRSGRRPSWLWICRGLTGLLLLKLPFGGLRGSRSNTVWMMLWALAIIHVWIRDVPRRYLVGGLLALVGFLNFYGFYKGAGPEGVAALVDSELRERLEDETGRTLSTALLGDLGRADVQALVLQRATSSTWRYESAQGATYLAAAALLIPRQLWPGRPEGKVAVGTNALYGPGAFESGAWRSSRIYGLAGEAILNFGPASVPLAFLVFGFSIGVVRNYFAKLAGNDTRRLLSPVLMMLSIWGIAGDADNVVVFLLKIVFVPALAIAVGSARLKTSPGWLGTFSRASRVQSSR